MPDAPSFEYFNVAIANPGEAVEAATKYLAKIKADVGVETQALSGSCRQQRWPRWVSSPGR
jgi:hypothetical protein